MAGVLRGRVVYPHDLYRNVIDFLAKVSREMVESHSGLSKGWAS